MSSTLRQLILLIVLRETACQKILSLNKGIRTSGITLIPHWDPRNAVDGNFTNTAFECNCCAIAGPISSCWFELDLGREFLIERIDVLGNAKTGLLLSDFSLNDMEIFLASKSEIENKTAITKVTSRQSSLNFTLAEKRETRYVTLHRNTYDPFIVCEVSVYGDCVDGEFGPDCGQRCHCEGKPCNKRTGVCPSGKCLSGFTGPACDKDCVDGKFGPDCGQRCHCEGKPCNKRTGVCPSGKCLSGYTGPACDKGCVDGEFGPDCGQRCHCEGKHCNKRTGVCPSGKCLPGFTGPACNTACEQGRYGNNCTEECGHCKDNALRDFIDGSCPNGCKLGYGNTNCNTPCPDGHFGVNCSSNCGNCLNGTSCTKDFGVCIDGCETGFIPPLCFEDNAKASCPDVKLYQVASAVGGACTLIMIVVMVAGICYVIRLRKRYRRQPTTSPPDISGPYELPIRSAVESEHQYGQTAPIYEEAESSYEIPK